MATWGNDTWWRKWANFVLAGPNKDRLLPAREQPRLAETRDRALTLNRNIMSSRPSMYYHPIPFSTPDRRDLLKKKNKNFRRKTWQDLSSIDQSPMTGFQSDVGLKGRSRPPDQASPLLNYSCFKDLSWLSLVPDSICCKIGKDYDTSKHIAQNMTSTYGGGHKSIIIL